MGVLINLARACPEPLPLSCQKVQSGVPFWTKEFPPVQIPFTLLPTLSPSEPHHPLFDQLAQPHLAGELFDGIPDTVYFVKDAHARYVIVNETLTRRCGAQSKEELLGKTALEVFPAPLGEEFSHQDHLLLQGGPDIANQLELHLYPNGASGWCLTWKKALRNAQDEVIGLAGISRDLTTTTDAAKDLEELSQVLTYIREHLDQALTLEDLAQATGLSSFQISQRLKRLFGLTPKQYIMRSRVEKARHLLTTTSNPLSEVALACGFSDQSSFTRQFKSSVGLTPKAYRDRSVAL